MRKGLFLVLALSSCLSYAGVSAIAIEVTMNDVYGNPDPQKAVSPQQALGAVAIQQIGMGAKKETQNATFVARDTAVYTDFGNYMSYAAPVVFDKDLPTTKVQINSYMIKPNKGRKFIFYPIATAFDSDRNLLATMLPSNDSKIKGNTIKNIFSVPEGTRYLLIHTDPRFLTFDIDSGDLKDSDSMNAGLASLGGAVGGIFHGILFNSQVSRGKVGIAPVGIVEVMEVEL